MGVQTRRLPLEEAIWRAWRGRSAPAAAVRGRELKQLVADLSLDKHLLQDVLSKKSEARSAARDRPVCSVETCGQRTAQLRNGRFRDECLNTHWFLSLGDARSKIDASRQDYNV
jgi:hypothetical protein